MSHPSHLRPVSCAAAVAAALLQACGTQPTPAEAADTLYIHGEIVTIDASNPRAQALAVKDGRIVAVGDETEVLGHRGPGTVVVDLDGRTMVPGFLDGHSHFINSLSVATQANVYAPPFGPGDSVAAIVSALKELQRSQQVAPGEMLMAYGYDGDALLEGRELCAADLDPHFPDNPVIVQHVSLHGGVLNSAALAKYGITADTPTPPGGIILRQEGSNEPAGLLMETAYLPIFSQLPKPAADQMMDRLEAGQRIFAAAGVTTAHEGASHLLDVAILRQGAREGRLFIDVVAYPFITDLEHVLRSNPASTFGTYRGGLKLAGVKVTLDGSPQGRTAYFTAPYLTGGPGGEQDWAGEPTFPEEQVQKMFDRVHGLGLPMNVHCNGDAAIDLFLRCFERAWGDEVTGDHRTAIIHSQFVRRDQLERYRDWKLIPSFYTEHAYFFAKTHLANRGREQAEFLSPMRTALDMGIRCSNHTDFNVSPVDQLFVIWTAVNRISREGQVLGADERITPFEALRAITLDTAYWYREEDQKGSLEVGKLADLVILDRNPLEVDPMEIKDIRVLETVKAGKTIYRRDGG
jgi:predicted amidohydrolase YtcJ